MADSKIADLPELAESPAVDDIVPIIDISDTTDSADGTNKKVTTANLVNATNVASAGAVMDTGNETIAGVKTFSSFPLTPSSAPTTDYQTANKKYVDDSISGSGGYTDEMAQDAVGAMIAGNTETGITVTYDDENAKLNFAVDSQTDNNFTTALKNKLDGIEASADVTDATNVASAGAVMEGDTSTASMGFVLDEDNMATNSATKLPTQQSVKAYADTKMANPMTTAGDTIYGGADGAPTRLAKGTAGQMIAMNAGATAPEWVDAPEGGGMENPMTTALDIIVGGVSGAPARLGKGTADQVLAMNSDASAIAWATPAGGSGGQSPYDAIVAATGGDYTTVKAALDAGKKKLLIQGTVTEGANLSYTGTIDNILIEGKDPEVDIIDFGWAYRADFLGASDNFINALTIRNITIKDPKAEYENNSDYAGLRVNYVKNLIVENVTFLGSSERDRLPNVFKYIQHGIIRGCRVEGYRWGITVSDTASGSTYSCNVVIENNVCTGYTYDSAAFWGIYGSGDNTNAVWIRNNAVHNFGIGIKSNQANVHNNYIKESRSSGNGGGCIYANGGTVSNNHIKMGVSMATIGINVLNECVVSDNTIVSGNTGTSRVGIRNAYNSNSIVGNRIQGVSSYGIALTADGDSTVVTGNVISSCGNTIEIPSGCDNNIVAHNILKGNTTNTITDSGTGNVPDPETENMFVA